jgi:hypothetical protein
MTKRGPAQIRFTGMGLGLSLRAVSPGLLPTPAVIRVDKLRRGLDGGSVPGHTGPRRKEVSLISIPVASVY